MKTYVEVCLLAFGMPHPEVSTNVPYHICNTRAQLELCSKGNQKILQTLVVIGLVLKNCFQLGPAALKANPPPFSLCVCVGVPRASPNVWHRCQLLCCSFLGIGGDLPAVATHWPSHWPQGSSDHWHWSKVAP